jgi:hypothetical protein
MKDEKLEELFTQLTLWSKTLSNRIEEVPKNIWHALEDDPGPAPSKGSAAEMELRAINKPLREVNGIYKMIEEHLLDKYD